MLTRIIQSLYYSPASRCSESADRGRSIIQVSWMLSNSNNTAPSIGTIAKRYITTGLFGLDAEGIYRMFFNTQLQALYPIITKVIRAEIIYFFLSTNILVSLPVTNDSLAKEDELEPVQRSQIHSNLEQSWLRSNHFQHKTLRTFRII